MVNKYLYHWSQGGDAITNFSAEQTAIYARAIDEHGDADLYIGPPTPNGFKSDKALRLRGAGRTVKDLSNFWAVFDQVFAAAKATGSAA